ncbi:MAG: hypothetical protein AB7I50_14650 [Vicinamibacterales bacterium]
MKRLGALACLVWCLVVGSAEAGNISLQWTGGVNVTVKFDATTINTAAGDFKLTATNNTLEPWLDQGQTFYTFCVDLQHYSTNPLTATWDWMSNWNMPAAGSNPAYPRTDNTQGRGRAAYLGSQYFTLYPTGLATNDVAAAYQLAIWELLYEQNNTFNVFSGSTYFTNISNSIRDAANTLIAGSAGHVGQVGWLRTDNTGAYAQDYMAPAPVPDALSTLGALGISLASLTSLRRRWHKILDREP